MNIIVKCWFLVFTIRVNDILIGIIESRENDPSSVTVKSQKIMSEIHMYTMVWKLDSGCREEAMSFY